MDAGRLVRETRAKAHLTQADLARRAGTTQTYVSRIERGVVSPSTASLRRLLAAMGYRLLLAAEPAAPGNASEADLRRDAQLSPEERLDQSMRLSQFLTQTAAAGRGR